MSSNLHSTVVVGQAEVRAKKRNEGVDYYRFVSLITIFLQHTPGIFAESTLLEFFLTFNVVAVIMGSALGTRLSTTSRPYTTYMWMKTKAILFPSYVYIIGAHFSQWAIGLPVDQLPTGLANFYFQFPYFWFIRGYMLIYAISPLIVRMHNSTVSHTKFFLKVLAINLILELFNYFVLNMMGLSNEGKFLYSYHINDSCYFPVYYAVLYRLPDLNNRQYWTFFAVLLFGLCGLTLKHYYVDKTSLHPHRHKGPMDSTYGSYGILCSMVLYKAIPLMEKFFPLIGLDIAGRFFSRHSLWLYLHHIAFIMPLYKFRNLHTIAKFVIIVFSAAGLTKMQTIFIDRVASRIPYPLVAQNLRIILG